MNYKMNKMRQFIKRHDELSFILILFIIVFGITMYIKTEPTDEVWNFQNIYKMYLGFKIYVDANVITTPLFHFLSFILFKVFGANFFIFKIYGVLINILLYFGVYKIFKSLKVPKLKSVFLTMIMFVAEINVCHNTSNYNNLALMFCIYGIVIIINREKYTVNKFLIIESILIFLIFLSKQNIGIYYFLAFIIYDLLYEEQRLKNLIKISFVLIFFLNIFCIILIQNGIFEGFVSYAILGLNEFAKNNFNVSLPVIKLFGIFIIDFILVYIINKKQFVEKEVIKKINIIASFAFCMTFIAYPILNVAHIDLAMMMLYILLLYILYVSFLNELISNKKILYFVCYIFILIFIFISIIKTILYFCKIDNKYDYNNIYFGALFEDEYKYKIEKMTEYIKKNNKRVIFLSTESALYMMPLKINNGNMDEPLLGNFGRYGENGVIREISNMKDTVILINKVKKISQESDKIIQYVKSNLVFKGEIEDFLIYETK